MKTTLKETPVASIDDLGRAVYDRNGWKWMVDSFPALEYVQLRTPAGYRVEETRVIKCDSSFYTRERPNFIQRVRNLFYELC